MKIAADCGKKMRSFPKSRRDQLAEARAGNAHVHAMYGDGRPPQIVYPPERPKQMRSVRDELVPSEHASQCAVISWWRLAHAGYGLPEFALFAIPNGGARDPITGSRLKAEGVRPGIPDLMLAVKRGTHGGLVIEMKKLHNQTNATQKEVLAYFGRAGYFWSICWTADAAIGTIKDYLVAP